MAGLYYSHAADAQESNILLITWVPEEKLNKLNSILLIMNYSILLGNLICNITFANQFQKKR